MKEFINFSEIYSGVITELAKYTGKKLYGYCEKFITDSIEKNKIDSGDAFIDYLEYSSDRYSKVKTLIYSRKAEYLYDFYLPPSLSRYKKSNKIDSSNIKNLLDIGNNLIITGTGGIGKSLMLKHFFLDTIRNTSFVPVFIELRNLNDFGKDDINLERFIYDELVKFRLILSQKFFEYSLEIGCYVMLFDGFDELKSEIADVVIKSIIDISIKYPDNCFIVSSRPWDGFIGWNNFEELEIMKFEKDQSLEMILKLNYDKSVKENFIKSLDDSLFEKYKSFATIPLLLTMMFLTYEKRPNLPDKLNDFYEQVFITLFYTHDSTKNGYVRQHRSKLGYEDFRLVFAYFCFKSYFKQDYKFSERKFLDYMKKAKDKRIVLINFSSENFLIDLNKSVCMLIKEGLEYKFSHRSFQEYFAAYYTTLLNDEQQKSLIEKSINNNIINTSSMYLRILYNLQPNRCINNVYKPFIDEMYCFYNQNNQKNESFIRFFIDSLSSVPGGSRKTSNDEWRLHVVYKGAFYYFLKEICHIFNYDYLTNYSLPNTESYIIASNNIRSYIYTKFVNEEIEGVSMKIDELLKSDIKEDLIIYFDELIKRSLFVINAIQDNKKDYSKKSLQDMLDEL